MEQLRGINLKRFQKSIEMHDLDIVLVLENIQFASNVAGIFRTADATKVSSLYLTGITPTPPFGNKLQKASRKKELRVPWKQPKTTGKAIQSLRKQGYTIVSLEITDQAIEINEFAKTNMDNKLAIVVGNEAQGISKKTLANSDKSVYIPMFGKGASLNVATSCAICLYQLIGN